MKTFSDPAEMKRELQRHTNMSIGFVPTMGAFHQGHISLIERAKEENQIVVVSIFVNPTQFDNKDDLNNYPSSLEDDISFLNKMNVDYLFTPSYADLYPDNYIYKVEETSFSKELCGRSRDGHFTGVLTVVMKLINIIQPGKAYFGEKDRQQLLLVQGMVDAFFMDVKIISSPTVREKDGLALSSRNRLLKEDERQIAALFPKLLNSEKSDTEIAEELNRNGLKTDYIETHGGVRYGAVFLGNVRLIDNVKL